ncbi:MAG: sensor histidine kinase [Chitinophagales bacterium]
MIFFEPLIALLLVRYLRITIKRNYPDSPLFRPLTVALYSIIVLWGLGFAIPDHDVVRWFWQLVDIGIILFMFKRPEFVGVRYVSYAFLPMVIVSTLRDITGLFHGEAFRTIENYLHYADPFVFIWMVAMLIISRRQQVVLGKERKARKVEEEQNRTNTARKKELEIMVASRTFEINRQKEELQTALHNLQDTQAQLIQSEKMASLGELTAGIAHEIQNPLNFVNNFSEVNLELIEEMKSELNKSNPKDAISIANDIRKNLEKIHHHGKRADAIVKGMLQHSRSSTGQKEETDINQIVDEYLGLSYHGLRAKDKSFNASIKKHLDDQAGNLEIIPQDIGRVLLNVYNNAFYAVMERKKMEIPGYNPLVTVTTKRLRNMVEIVVRDNGNGIPEKVADKIFQPFFTTKPSGQGTGLGLSISYDIVTKGHGGKMTFKTREGEFTEFCIQLPADSKT